MFEGEMMDSITANMNENDFKQFRGEGSNDRGNLSRGSAMTSKSRSLTPDNKKDKAMALVGNHIKLDLITDRK